MIKSKAKSTSSLSTGTALFGYGALLILLGLTPAIGGEPPSPAVSVEKEPAEVERKTFDPANPPADMPPHTPLEAGLCEYRFGCQVEVLLNARVSWRTSVRASVTSLRLKTQLRIVVWVAENAPKKISDHEEAHREIAERYYVQAEPIARRVGEAAIGRKIDATVQDGKLVADEGLKTLENELLAQYLEETGHRCDFAQVRFDTITNHARNSFPEADATADAIGDEEMHYMDKAVSPKTESKSAETTQ